MLADRPLLPPLLRGIQEAASLRGRSIQPTPDTRNRNLLPRRTRGHISALADWHLGVPPGCRVRFSGPLWMLIHSDLSVRLHEDTPVTHEAHRPKGKRVPALRLESTGLSATVA